MPATDSATKWVENLFQSSIVPTLVDYIKIPNKSAMFDPEWRKNGHMERLQGCDATVIDENEAIIIQTPTAGGYGTPENR